MTKEDIIKQIDLHLQLYQDARQRSKYNDLSDIGDAASVQILTRLAAAIDRLAPTGSTHKKIAHEASQQYGATHAYNIEIYLGILSALRADYELGYFQNIEELIHADMFSDFLEMAAYLLSEGYKDPAAILTGGVLEEHLRKLCIKNNIAIEQNGKARKADSMNADLAGTGALSKLDQKSVSGWLDLRNKAAHGKYSEYDKQQVELLLQCVRDFLIRIPA